MPEKDAPPPPTLVVESPPTPEVVDFIYRIDGDNQLELSELIPILSSLGELIQEGNRIMYPDAPDIAISVKPFEEGSFEIEMLLRHEVAAGLFVFIQAGGIKQIFDVLSNIGLVATKAKETYTSLLGLFKTLKGAPPKEVKEVEKGKFEVTTQKGDVVQINAPVQNLYLNSTVVQNLSQIYNEPLKKPKRKKIQSYLKGEKKDTLVEFTPKDVPALTDVKPLALPTQTQSEQETEHTNVVFLRPKRGSFEGEAAKWSFRKGGTQGEVVQANIKDHDFLKKLQVGEYRLSSSDVLKVELREKQRVVGSDIRTTTEIVKVLDYKPAPRQASMDLDGKDGGS